MLFLWIGSLFWSQYLFQSQVISESVWVPVKLTAVTFRFLWLPSLLYQVCTILVIETITFMLLSCNFSWMKLNLVVLHEDFVNILMSFLNTRLPRGKALIKPVYKNFLDLLLLLQFLIMKLVRWKHFCNRWPTIVNTFECTFQRQKIYSWKLFFS